MVALVNKCDMSGSRQSGCGNQPSDSKRESWKNRKNCLSWWWQLTAS